MTNHPTCIFSMCTHLAAYSVSQPVNWSEPNIMPYPDVLSNYTYTYAELDWFRLTFLMISTIIWLVDLPPTTRNSITSLVSHLPPVQTAERCRLFVILQDRDKLNPEYGGSWYQPARKKKRCYNLDVSFCVSIRIISWRHRGEGEIQLHRFFKFCTRCSKVESFMAQPLFTQREVSKLASHTRNAWGAKPVWKLWWRENSQYL